MKLIVVESPVKGKTIEKFLGPDYRVYSSYGHIRDLPKSKFGIDIENNFEPKYIIPLKTKKNVTILKKEANKSDLIILATDEDREGEAIAYHLVYLLNLDSKKPYQRIVFHEITKSAIEQALKNPRKIDMDLVDAQQTRRVLDRIVGYKLSPFLWKKVARGLSAGRVQSVAVKFVVEREKEIKNFVPQEYWAITAHLKKITEDGPLSVLQRTGLYQVKESKLSFPAELQREAKVERRTEFSSTPVAIARELEAILVKKDGKTITKLGIKTKKEAGEIVTDLEGAEYKIINVEKKEIKRNPLPPFTTSSLQQTAWQRFKWPAKMTMRIAQQLYETGKISYHRTDSLNLSEQALFSAKKFIEEKYGKEYWAGYLRKYKTRVKGAQEAHEAIRPTYPNQTPETLRTEAKLDDRQFGLYDLIWRRFIACQMSQSRFDSTKVEIEAKCKRQKAKGKIYGFQANGSILKFDGFLKVYPIKKYEETELPVLETNEILELIKLIPSQHFTQPPARYNEATLIKDLEENGLGRPSTYAPILSNIQEKNYIEKDEQKRFRPTEIGTVVNNLLIKHFPEIVDIGFTANMEKNLDEIAEGKRKWVPVIKEFYTSFEETLKQKYQEVSKKEFTEKPTEKICPKCGALLLIRLGKYGKFYACSAFPKCRYTESLEENNLGIKCPKCKKGKVVQKRTRKHKIFYGCNQFPKCDFALWDKPTEEKCPKCKSLLVETKRRQIKCSNKECDYKIEK